MYKHSLINAVENDEINQVTDCIFVPTTADDILTQQRNCMCSYGEEIVAS